MRSSSTQTFATRFRASAEAGFELAGESLPPAGAALGGGPDAEFDIPNQLLVRFWVNGKPVAPAPATRVAFIVRSGRAPAPPEHVQFSLAVTAADLGAAPADKIEMQLLLSPDGYDHPNMRLINVARRITAAAPLPVLSNRITLALPAATEPAGAKSP